MWNYYPCPYIAVGLRLLQWLGSNGIRNAFPCSIHPWIYSIQYRRIWRYVCTCRTCVVSIYVCSIYAGAHGLRIELISEIVLLEIRLKLCRAMPKRTFAETWIFWYYLHVLFVLGFDFRLYVMYSCSKRCSIVADRISAQHMNSTVNLKHHCIAHLWCGLNFTVQCTIWYNRCFANICSAPGWFTL